MLIVCGVNVTIASFLWIFYSLKTSFLHRMFLPRVAKSVSLIQLGTINTASFFVYNNSLCWILSIIYLSDQLHLTSTQILGCCGFSIKECPTLPSLFSVSLCVWLYFILLLPESDPSLESCEVQGIKHLKNVVQ